jgi:hypothetical protein
VMTISTKSSGGSSLQAALIAKPRAMTVENRRTVRKGSSSVGKAPEAGSHDSHEARHRSADAPCQIQAD